MSNPASEPLIRRESTQAKSIPKEAIDAVKRAKSAQQMTWYDHPEFENHEKIHFAFDKPTGLKAIIAIHTTRSGLAIGGCRMEAYECANDALTDVLRLSKGMSRKCAIVGFPLGGAKAVIIGDPNTKPPELLAAYGRFVDELNGAYVTAEDVNINADDVEQIAKTTRHVVGRQNGPAASGNPSPITAKGVVLGIKESLRFATGSPDLRGRRIAIQGAGSVGGEVARLAFAEGAELIIADKNAETALRVAAATNAKLVDWKEIQFEEVDVFSPNAMGGIIDEDFAKSIRAKAVAGAANNQLKTDYAAEILFMRKILYAPDYIINAGGLINCVAELRCTHLRHADSYDRAWVEERLGKISITLRDILGHSIKHNVSPHRVAEAEARARIETQQTWD